MFFALAILSAGAYTEFGSITTFREAEAGSWTSTELSGIVPLAQLAQLNQSVDTAPVQTPGAPLGTVTVVVPLAGLVGQAPYVPTVEKLVMV